MEEHKEDEEEKRRAGGAEGRAEWSGGSHHVRLYSQTKSAALTAISHCVTFSPSPWFCCFLPGLRGSPARP